MKLKDRLANQLESRRKNQSLRQLSVTSGLIDFTSNDYLGLSRSKELQDLISNLAKEQTGNGATGSRLLSGNSAYTEKVETMLAQVLGAERVLIFNSGYTANLAVLSSLPQRGDTILYDDLAHACIKDGARLSLANRYSFRHNDPDDLEQKLKTAKGNVFIVAESVYSMDGDICPLPEITAIADHYNAHIVLDEAHGTGILGPNGSGLSGQLGLNDKVDIRVYTFGKAMGIHGAAVACDDLFYQYLINFARPFIYTTALTPHSIASIEGAFSYLQDHITLQSEARQRVRCFIDLFDKELSHKFQRTSSVHPVQGILVPGNEAARKAAQHLQQDGFDVRPIMSPTVKEGEERLRVCLHIYNSDNDISGLIHSLAAL